MNGSRNPPSPLRRIWMAAVPALLLLLSAGVPAARADAPDIEFRPPAEAEDAATAMIMRDLAARLVPVYQEPDPDRYLANLSVLQMAALDYTAADGSRLSLRARRRSTEAGLPVGRGIIYDMYARARAMQAEDHSSFADSFAKSFRDMVSGLDDHDAYTVMRWLEAPPAEMRNALQAALDGLRNKDRIDQAEAVELIRSYVSFDAFRAFNPLIGALGAEDDARRYVMEEETIAAPHGARIAATVIRPKSLVSPMPALFELALDGSRNTAKECAAHGYAGVVAHSLWNRSAPGELPFEHEGEAARAVIAWIAGQPWSDGRVAMYGEGYGAFTAWAAAKRAPPALKAIATSSAMAPGISFPMQGSIFHNSAYRWSLREPVDAAAEGHGNGSGSGSGNVNANGNGVDDAARWAALDEAWYVSGRRYRDFGRIVGKPNPIFIRWLNHPSYDRYWQRLLPYGRQFAKLAIPVLTTTGYYSAGQPADLYLFSQHLKYDPHANHTLVVGPYDDGAVQNGPAAMLRGYRIDSAAAVDLRELRYQWFDHVLRGAAAPALLEDRVNYQVMGSDEWRHAPSLEAMAGRSLKLYLDAGDSDAVHPLTMRRSPKAAFVQQIVNFADRTDGGPVPLADLAGKAVATPNAALFVGEPLEEAAELSGSLSGRLDFKVNKMDMDLYVTLYEQLAGGDYVRLFDPSYEFRASYARDRTHRHLLRAGERQELTFRMERLTSRLLQKGSRVVLVIGINKRPDRELNYGSGNDVSEESLADARAPLKVRWYNDSYLELPVGVPAAPAP
jgi:putative CocE/NonD family hydrolase